VALSKQLSDHILSATIRKTRRAIEQSEKLMERTRELLQQSRDLLDPKRLSRRDSARRSE
jgi:hypothetical protein